MKIALVCALSLCLMLIGFSSAKRRLSLALALVAFALVFANVAPESYHHLAQPAAARHSDDVDRGADQRTLLVDAQILPVAISG